MNRENRALKKHESYGNWRKDSIRKEDGAYHLIHDGILSRRDYNVLFETENQKNMLPIEITDALNVYSNVHFNSQFFQFAGRNHLYVNVFDAFGRKVGSFVPESNTKSGIVMLKQASIYLNPLKRLEYARNIELASMKSIRMNVKYYLYRNKSPQLEECDEKLSQTIKRMKQSDSLVDLLTAEACARLEYYHAFNSIIRSSAFQFTERSRRPPKDMLNALISFGNVWLYNRIATEINKTTMDIRIGLVHATNRRSQSLNLDIADMYKPLIVDRAIFSMVNKCMIDEDKHFQKFGTDGVYLNTEGKKIFIKELNRKVYARKKTADGSYSWDSIIRMDISRLRHAILHGEVYQPWLMDNF